eukprot:CAMPEP_0198229780 /NCGR_PEP_ID=MMETSP1445-20131203/114303_1 /TAXON_ID=36898 /ORGANISM="Pyramimonas sp., Strain CCMP2087" /LENGTH=241 /DNA_ID=CAMNT_0043910255 /DNA_START=119 /DNA_END=844 /DNA_ORIENTATION=-
MAIDVRGSSTCSVCAWLVVLSLGALVAANSDDYYEYGADYDYATDWEDGDCLTGEDGVSRVNGTVCDIEVSGADTIVSYAAGVTGIFRYTGECQNGRPGYKRDDVPGQASGMWLFYSKYWGDWDFCNATVFRDYGDWGTGTGTGTGTVSCVIGYGGDGYGESRPQDILEWDWFVLKDLVANQTTEEDFVSAPKLSVKCILAHEDGTAPQAGRKIVLNRRLKSAYKYGSESHTRKLLASNTN